MRTHLYLALENCLELPEEMYPPISFAPPRLCQYQEASQWNSKSRTCFPVSSQLESSAKRQIDGTSLTLAPHVFALEKIRAGDSVPDFTSRASIFGPCPVIYLGEEDFITVADKHRSLGVVLSQHASRAHICACILSLHLPALKKKMPVIISRRLQFLSCWCTSFPSSRFSALVLPRRHFSR